MKTEKAKSTDNLKPCPFCGSSGDNLEITCTDLLDAQAVAVGQIEILPDTNPVVWCVHCVVCYAVSPNADCRGDACHRWNQRITETALIEGNLKPCPFCGASGNNLMEKRIDWRGAENVFEIPPDSSPVFHGVSCELCRAGGPTGDTRRGSCQRWNERPRGNVGFKAN